MSKILGDTRQKQTERELKKKWIASSKLRGQQTLTSGASTSRRLSFYEELEKVVDDLL